MNTDITLSSVILTLSIAVSSFCYILMGFDAVGEPTFERIVYDLCLLSPVLPLAAITWFLADGNSADRCVRNIVVGHLLGFVGFVAWIAILVGDLATLSVLPIFFLPMVLMACVHLFMLSFALALGAGLTHVFRWIWRSRRVGNR